MTKPRSGKTAFALSVCASVKDSKPDLYNAVPTRAVSYEEAVSHGWPHFYDGKNECSQGHVAARYVSNKARCIDCARIADGKLPLYTKRSNEDLISSAVTSQTYTDPLINTNFKWDDEKFRVFGVAYVNSGSVEKALSLVGATPNDLITELRRDAQRQAQYEAIRRDVDQVFLWKAEASASTGSDRAMLAHAGAISPDRFGSRTKQGLDTPPYVNPDKACAELTQLLSTARRSLTQRTALGSTGDAGARVENTQPVEPNPADPKVEAPVLLGQPLDHSDLV
jgi:hypothetical protein